jgi:putative ATP-dependent endonuclease of OLD family
MLLSNIKIANFRGITSLSIPLDRTTVLIGENNTGKTSVLDALHSCLNRGMHRRAVPFNEYDYHLSSSSSDPTESPPLTVTLTFTESAEDEWPEEIDQAFNKALQLLSDNRKQLTFQVISQFDKTLNDYKVEWAFLDNSGAELPTAKQQKLVSDLQSLAPVFLLAAIRDASNHFHAKSPFWSPFTKNSQIDEATRAELEEQIGALNQSILDNHTPFEDAKKGIAKTGALLPLAATNIVSVEAIPARIHDMLAKTQVKVACKTGAKLPIMQHGAGTQSLAILFLFEAFLQSQLAQAYDKDSSPILALEEPESHLHPSAIRALWSTLEGLAGQKIIATHSGDLLAAVPLKAVRRLARKSSKVEVYKLPENLLTSAEERKIAYHVRAKRGSLLFAKSWLLVEGESEYWFMPEAAQWLGHDFEQAGVSCVEFAQCGLECLIKLAIAFGIEWHVLADADQAGQKYANVARKYLSGDPEAQRLTLLPEKDIEHTLWTHGYDAVYQQVASQCQQAQPTPTKQCADGSPCSWVAPPIAPAPETLAIRMATRATSKPEMAIAVIDALKLNTSPGLPAAVEAAITTAVKNALL